MWHRQHINEKRLKLDSVIYVAYINSLTIGFIVFENVHQISQCLCVCVYVCVCRRREEDWLLERIMLVYLTWNLCKQQYNILIVTEIVFFNESLLFFLVLVWENVRLLNTTELSLWLASPFKVPINLSTA